MGGFNSRFSFARPPARTDGGSTARGHVGQRAARFRGSHQVVLAQVDVEAAVHRVEMHGRAGHRHGPTVATPRHRHRSPPTPRASPQHVKRRLIQSVSIAWDTPRQRKARRFVLVRVAGPVAWGAPRLGPDEPEPKHFNLSDNQFRQPMLIDAKLSCRLAKRPQPLVATIAAVAACK